MTRMRKLYENHLEVEPKNYIVQLTNGQNSESKLCIFVSFLRIF